MPGLIHSSVLSFFWAIHAILLILVGCLGRNKTNEIRAVSVIFIFYSIAPLMPFEFEVFKFHVSYVPSLVSLVAYAVTDVLFVLFIFYFPRAEAHSRSIKVVKSVNSGYGYKLLTLVALAAFFINFTFNYELLLLPKHKFIASLNNEYLPNLFFLNIPASEILVGAMICNPFKRSTLRVLIAAAGAMALMLSLFQGYRHIALVLFLLLLFRWKSRGGILESVTLLTIIGEISNPLKYLISGILLNDQFSTSAFIDFQLANKNNFKWISGEQLAVFSNFIIGINFSNIHSNLFELYSIIPFSSGAISLIQTGAQELGEIAGVGTGQGVGYNFQLFFLNTLGFGSLYIFVLLFLVRLTANTVLSVLSITNFLSLLRDTPAYWCGQIKMLMFLFLAVFLFERFISDVVITRARYLQRKE